MDRALSPSPRAAGGGPGRGVAFLIVLMLGCASAPPVPEGERFKVTCAPSDNKDECIITVKALFPPPADMLHFLHGEPKLVDGAVQLEIHGWHMKADRPGQEEGTVEAKVGVKPGVPFKLSLLYLGHKDDYTVTIPEKGDPQIEPDKGEFSERG